MSMNKLPEPKQGEVWLVDLNPTQGTEISKIRPAVVVSCDSVGKLPLRIVVPLTDWKSRYEAYPWFTALTPSRQNGLSKSSGADGFQIRSISCERFKQKLGCVAVAELEDIIVTITFCLGK